MISIVAAISENNCIGKNGELPWNIPEDMKRVKELTTGKVVIMGRKTWESIPDKYRPLPKRTNVVITRDTSYTVPAGVEVFQSIDEALSTHPNEDIVGFGGQRIFEEMINKADRLYITKVHKKVDGCNAFFPIINPDIFTEIERKNHIGFSFLVYERKH